MAVGKMRRAPDSGVSNAVSTIIEHQKFKKMLVFGLRSLSDLCNPSNQLYVENALEALERNVVKGILTAVENFGDDEDLVLCSTTIMSTMSQGCVEYREDENLLKKLVNEGGVDVVQKALERAPQDEDVLENCLKFLENLSNLGGLGKRGPEFVPHVCKCMEVVKSYGVANRLVVCLSNLTNQNESCLALKNSQGVQPLLDLCLKFTNQDKSTGLVESCFKTLVDLSQLKLVDESNLQSVINLVECCKDSKVVLSRASEVIKSVVDTEKLQNSLKVLEKNQYDSPEYKVAVNTLRSLSYISTLSDELAKKGVIPILLKLLSDSSEKLGSGDAKPGASAEQLAEVVFGTSRMLASISSSNSEYAQQVLSNKGLDVLVRALSQSTQHPRSVVGLSFALVQLLKHEPKSFGSAVSVALPILYQLSEDEAVSQALVEFLLACSQYSELESVFIQNKVLEILSTCCQYHTSNLAYQFNVVSILNRFSRFIENLKLIHEYGGLQGITFALEQNYKDLKYCLEVLNFISALASTSNSQKYLTTGDYLIADVILELMLHYRDNDAVIDLSVKILDLVLEEKDVEKYAKRLNTAMPNSVKDPEGTFKALTALTGVHKISRLRPLLSKYNPLNGVLSAVTGWLDHNGDPEWVRQRTNLTRAALSLVVVCQTKEEIQETLFTVSELACVYQVKKVIDLEQSDDNFLLHCTGAMVVLCGIDRTYDEAEMQESVECVSKVMKRHQDVRQAQASLLEALNRLMEQSDRLFLSAMLNTGCLGLIVKYLSTVPVYLNLQILGIGLIHKCSQLDPQVVEFLKTSNCFQLLRTVNRTHTKNKKLKAIVGSLLSLLMPADALESELDQLLKDLVNYVAEKDAEGVNTCLVSINQLLVSKEAVKAAVMLNIYSPVKKALDWTLANPNQYNGEENIFEPTLAEFSLLGLNMLVSRMGLVYATKNSFTKFFLTLFTCLTTNSKVMMEDGVVSNLDGLVLLFRHDVTNIDEALKEDLLAKLSGCFTRILNSPAVVSSVCRCLGSMCATPGKLDKLLNNSNFSKFCNYLVDNLSSPQNTGSMEKEKVVETTLVALNELLSTKYQILIDYFDKNTKIVSSLVGLLEEYYKTYEIVVLASNLLSYFDKRVVLSRLSNLSSFLETVSKTLLYNKADVGTVIALLTLLVHLLDDSNKEEFKKTSVVENISTVMLMHLENDEVSRLGGILFSLLGAECQISALMKNVIQIVQAKEENMGQKVDKLCLMLAMYLSSELKERSEALKHTEPFLSSLNDCVSFLADNCNLLSSTCCVSRRLCDSAFEDHEDPFGAWAVASSSNMAQISSLVKTEYGYSNLKFLVHAFRVFTACVYNGYTSDTMLGEAPGLMVRTVQVLERYKENSELVFNVLEYCMYLANATGSDPASTTPGVQVLLENFGNPVDLITSALTVNKNNEFLLVIGFNLLAKLVSSTKTLDANQVSSSVETCLKLTKTVSTKGDTVDKKLPQNSSHLGKNLMDSYVRYFNAAYMNGYLDNYMSGDVVSNMVMMFEGSNFEGLSPVQFALFVLNSATAGEMAQLERLGVVQKLIGLFEGLLQNNKALSKDELLQLFSGLSDAVKRDAIKAVLVFKEIFPKLKGNEVLTSDAEVVSLLLNTLIAAAEVKGVGSLLHSIDQFVKYLDLVSNLSPDLVTKLKTLIKKDLPKKKTCETVYENLTELTNSGSGDESVSSDYSSVTLENALMMEDFRFVSDLLLKYNGKTQKSGDPECRDFGFGFKCVDVWSRCEGNPNVMAKSGLSALLISALAKQSDLVLTDALLVSICSCCKQKDLLLSFVSNKELVPNADAFLAKAYQKRLVTTGADPSINIEAAYENVLFNAMLLIDLTAVNRKVYLKSNVIPSLMEVWTLHDQNKYSSTKILRQVFRTLRKIVSDQNVQLMVKCKLVQRVNKVFSQLTTESKGGSVSSVNEGLIPDALFLIGSMAIILEIKEEICNVQLLEKIVTVLVRYVKSGSSSPIVTNCCLALANICVDFKTASDKFCSLNGPRLNLDVFVNFKSNFEVANGSSILLCNLLYKNDKLKELYGKNGTPSALVECLMNFVGSTEPTSLRCLQSLFKAISNLGLYTKNLQYFMEAHIESPFKKWLNKVSHTKDYDVELVKVGLNCLSNLVVENNGDYMRSFGVILEDLVGMLNLEFGDGKVVFLVLDVLNNLCRSKENAGRFVDLEGVFATVKNMRRLSYDVEVLVTGIHLFRHMAYGNGAVKLLEVDIFSFLLDILVQANELNDVVISSLRCLRRLVHSPEMVYLLCSQDGLDTVIKCSTRMKDQSSVLVESIRLILGMLYYTDPYTGGVSSTKQSDSDESTGLSDGESDYGWENIGMTATSIVEVIKFSCYVASLESCLKMSRLQSSVVSLCVYFMSCGLCGEELAMNGFSLVLENFISSFCLTAPNLALLAISALEASFNYPPDLRNSILTKPIQKKLRDLTLVVTDKQSKAKLTKLLEHVSNNTSPSVIGKFDLGLSEWNVDPYPNGVHDLPESMKEMLRNGGKFQLITEGEEEFKRRLRRGKEFEYSWRSSQDLLTLEWMHDGLQEKNKVAFMRVRNIARGLKHDLLVKANQKDYKRVSNTNTLVLLGSSTEEFPQGFALPMVFKNNHEREAVAEAFIQWRDASSFN
uniref:Anonymous antigen-1 n=1 Tax=Theileria annulata TaxID=5874 RepID=A0A3B0MHG4_THEAN